MKPRGEHRGRVLIMAAGDAALAVAVFSGIVWLRRLVRVPGTAGLLPAFNVPLTVPWLLVIAGVVLGTLYLADTYDEPAASVRERGGLLLASILAAFSLVGIYFAVGRSVPRTVLLVLVPALYAALELWRAVAERLFPIGIRPVLVLGGGEDARRAAGALEAGEITGHTLLSWRRDLAPFRSGVLDTGPGSAVIPPGTRDVVFASEQPEDRVMLVGLLERSLRHDFDLWILPGLTDIVASRIVTKSLGDLPLTPVATRGASLAARAFRRTIDLVVGTALCLLSLPVLAVVSVLVRLDSPGAAWIRQRRVGRDGEEFDILKVRTMVADAEAGRGPTMAEPNDDRMTRIGRALRRTRLDELPQLLLVVSGRMSLIGPRPERPEFVTAFEREVPAYRLRHLLKPGLTGLAQVMGQYATKPDVKLRYDLGYLFHWNPGLDLFILLRTVATVLKGSGV